MTEPGFLLMKSRIVQMLNTGLDPRLTYHNRHHTEDVLQHAERIALAENISDIRLLLLIKIAALFHDTGYLYTYRGHEEQSCVIMDRHLSAMDFNQRDIVFIGETIMATKVPQSPVTMAAKILCDADLDYLGRDDFEMINGKLKEELLAYRLIECEDWDHVQVNFLEKHRYFTEASYKDRNPGKLQHLRKLKENRANERPKPD